MIFIAIMGHEETRPKVRALFQQESDSRRQGFPGKGISYER